MENPKIAIVLGATCAGCDYSLLDLPPEVLLDVLGKVEIVYWPTATDFKLEDLKAVPDGEIALTLYEGAVNNEENEELARISRQKSQNLLAFGACSCFGGLPGLANVTTREGLFRQAYLDAPSNESNGVTPLRVSTVDGHELTIPDTFDTVRALHQVVPVDYYLPGCPPPLDLIGEALTALVTGDLPPKGHVFGSSKSLCDECDRRKESKSIHELHGIHELIPDEEKCLLEQGILCLGPATRGGCGYPCVKMNLRCWGCMGPTPESIDQGANMLSALASVLGLDRETDLTDEAIEVLMKQVKDPLGFFYRFTMPTSLLKRAVRRNQ